MPAQSRGRSVPKESDFPAGIYVAPQPAPSVTPATPRALATTRARSQEVPRIICLFEVLGHLASQLYLNLS